MGTFIQTASGNDTEYHNILDKILNTARAVVEARRTKENTNDLKIDFYVSEFLKYVENIKFLYRQLRNSKQLPRETLQSSCLPGT